MSVGPSEQPETLANELLILIIYHCQNDTKTLHSLSLVNTLFYTFSQPHLYQEMTSTIPSQHAAFFHILTRKPHLAKCVKRYDSCNLVENMDRGLWDTTLYMIGQMDNLEHLGLRIHDTYRSTSLFNNISPGPMRLDRTHFKGFKLRSVRFRRYRIYPRLEEAWWNEFVQSQESTLEVLDLGEIQNFYSNFQDGLIYPRLKVIKGDWRVISELLPKRQLRIVDVTDEIDASLLSGLDLELSQLEGFSSRFLGPNSQRALLLQNVVEYLHGVKFLGIPHQIKDLTYIKYLIRRLPPTGIDGLQTITLLWDEQWDPCQYQNIGALAQRFIDVFKMCPNLRFIDIELPSGSGMHTSTYHRIECKTPGKLYQYRFFTFQADAVFKISTVNRSRRCFYFE